MQSLLARISVKLKLSLIAGIFLFVIGIFAFQLISKWNEELAFSQKELEGTVFYAPAYQLIKASQLHRGASMQLDDTNPLIKSKLESSAADIGRALDTLRTLELQHTNIIPPERLKEIATQWKTIAHESHSLGKEERFATHSQLIEKIQAYIETFSDGSNLTLDPEISTFYLMNMSSFTFPQAIEHLARLRGIASSVLQDGDISDDEQKRLIAMNPIAIDKIDTATISAQKADAQINHVLQTGVDTLLRAKTAFAGHVTEIESSKHSNLTPDQLFSEGTRAIDAAYSLTGEASNELQRLLIARIDKMEGKRLFATIVLGLCVATALALTAIIAKAIIQTLDQANQHLEKIKAGNLDNQIDVKGSDELSGLMRGILAMQSGLRDAREREEKTAAEIKRMASQTKRIADALEVCDTPVMIADSTFTIDFLNKSVQSMMSRRETELRQELPGFDSKKLLGASIDIFHKNPSHQRALLANLREPYHTAITIGGLTMSLTATPLFDQNGIRAGTVVEWNDQTEQIAKRLEEQRIANENLRVRIALDNSSTNTMIADTDNNIIYMNRAMQSMMNNAEPDLKRDLSRFSASTLMNSNMDIFHRNPAHQRNLISNLTGTYRAQVDVGGRTFQLTANPVNNAANERLGTVVEWLDRTQEVRVEHEVENLVTAASSGNFSQRIDEQGKQGFFAVLAKGLNQMMHTANMGLLDVARVLSAMAQGNLGERITADYEGVFLQLKNDTNSTVETLTDVITRILDASQTVSTGADEISAGNADLSQRTEEQASSLEQTAASMEEMTGSVKHTSDNAQHANQLSENAVQKAETGGAVVRRAVNAMAEINDASKRIADIIGVIDEIAFQTNLLALNAAVEAARAGEQGRGFAVVAGEVRNLAQRSAGAAKEIKDLIRDSVTKVQSGTELVNASGKTFDEIVIAIRDVSRMISDINSAAREQSASIIQINQAISQMDEMTQQNAALVEQASAAGEAMAEQAKSLAELMNFFQVDGATAKAVHNRG